MESEDLANLSAGELAAAYRKAAFSPVEVVDTALRRIDRLNPGLNAFVLVDPDGARAAARRAEAAFTSGGSIAPLTGIPVSVKDNILTAGMRSTMGSPLFREQVPERDSGVVAAVRKAGAIILGKTNTPAFGWTGITDNMLFGPSRNPWNPALTPGGSSGGGAVATATGMVPIGIGTDGGGSLRTPAAFTGCIGFKPTHGRLPDTPAHPHWLIQHYGPLTRSVRDVALFMDAATGPDAEDPHSLPRYTGSYLDDIERPPTAPRALFTTQLGWVTRVDPEIEAACRQVAADLAGIGWRVEEKALAWTDPAPFANVISSVGFRHRLAAYRHRREEIEPGIQQILEAADALPPHAFYEAYLARNEWCAQPSRLFETIDLLITPATASLPFEIGRLAPETIADHKVPGHAWNPYLRAFNLTGQPAISIPIGFSAQGLPIGLQIVGPRHGDAPVLAAAAAIERMRPMKAWRER